MEFSFLNLIINVIIILIAFYIGCKIGSYLFMSKNNIVENPTRPPVTPKEVFTEIPKNSEKKPKTPSELAQDVFNKQFQDIVSYFERDILSYMQSGQYTFNSFNALYNKLPKEATYKALQQASKSFHKANPSLELDATFDKHTSRGYYVRCQIKFRNTS